MNAAQRGNGRRWLVGVLACFSFLLQQFVLPLHLALNEHVLVSDLEEHVHLHPDESHERHEEQADHGHGHEPHPIGDHVEQLAGPAALPTLVKTKVAAAPAAAALPVVDLPERESVHREQRAPRPPPPRIAAAPRAPPIAL